MRWYEIGNLSKNFALKDTCFKRWCNETKWDKKVVYCMWDIRGGRKWRDKHETSLYKKQTV